jgi:hypothetical protein
MSSVEYETGRVDGYSRGREDEQERIITLFSKDLCEECAIVDENIDLPNLSCKDKVAIIALIKKDLNE